MREWLWAVGSFYAVLGVRFTPVFNASQFTRVLTGWTAPPSSTEFKVAVDWEWTFGLDLLVIGVVAIVAASGNAGASFPVLVWLISARELVGGVLPDAWFIHRGCYNRRLYAGFIALHLVIAGIGLLLLARSTA